MDTVYTDIFEITDLSYDHFSCTARNDQGGTNEIVIYTSYLLAHGLVVGDWFEAKIDQNNGLLLETVRKLRRAP